MGVGDEKARDIMLTGMVTGVSDELLWCCPAGECLDNLCLQFHSFNNSIMAESG